MRKYTKIISFISLLFVTLAPVLYYAGNIMLETSKVIMTIATVTWFASALCWMGRTASDTESR